jgi:protein-L-isoaspartate(D-aspartate) O-methyltransferase
MTDSQLQRLNMVESQVRTSDVTDRRIIKTMLEVPRERFVPPALASMAYMDDPLPVGPAAGNRALLSPRALAKLLQLAEIGPDAIVLDVGCATGYSTAVLAKMAKRVVAVETDPSLAEFARKVLGELGIANVSVLQRALGAGAAEEAPFETIVINGGVQVVPPGLLEQLEDGGRLVAITTEGVMCRAQVWCRTADSFDTRSVFEAGAALLPGFERPAQFVF